jgi:beta-glucosidase
MLITAAALLAPAVADAARPIYRDPAEPVSARVDDLLSRMSLDDKLGQMTQVERNTVAPADLAGHRIGSVLSGGGSGPAPNTPAAWADVYDGLQRGALAAPLGIPMIYGIDAVHGHNNVAGATLFPHNIGLGAAHDPCLIRDVQAATARQVRATGQDWAFAPTLAVVRDDRWGRTYEGFSEDPRITRAYGYDAMRGLQGHSRHGIGSDGVIGTAKHFIGDGGTEGGKDQGVNPPPRPT